MPSTQNFFLVILLLLLSLSFGDYKKNECKECIFKRKPCLHQNGGVCYDYIPGGGCYPGTFDCTGKKDCDFCSPKNPCLHNGIGNNICFKKTHGSCPPYTTNCFKKNVKDINNCDICSFNKPCIHINGGVCFGYIPNGGCYPSTIDCTGRKDCDYCTNKFPCLHDGIDNNQCFPLNQLGLCPHGTTNCFKKQIIHRKTCDICNDREPCLHEYDGICYEYTTPISGIGGCPRDTTDCTGKKECDYCTYEYPCFDKNKNECSKRNGDGFCDNDKTSCFPEERQYAISQKNLKNNFDINKITKIIKNNKFNLFLFGLFIILICFLLFFIYYLIDKKINNKNGYEFADTQEEQTINSLE